MDSIKLIGCIGLLFAGLCGKAADNKEGIELYQSGMYDVSKIYFLKNLETIVPEQKMEAYYYLGENYVMLGQIDSARIYYEKGMEIQPEYPYNRIGIVMLKLKEAEEEAEDIFKEVLKTKGYKKDVRLQVALAGLIIMPVIGKKRWNIYNKLRSMMLKADYPIYWREIF